MENNKSQGTLYNDLIRKCREAYDGEIVAACLHGSRAGGYHRENSDFDVLMILEEYPEGIRYNYLPFLNVHISLLLVDEELFKLDVSTGGLGEFVAGRILTPYVPLLNRMYLEESELTLKKRVCIEELEEIIIEYGELSRGIIFRPEFIALSRMRKRARAYPPLGYSYLKLLSSKRRDENLKAIVDGYMRALNILEREGVVKGLDGLYEIRDSFIDGVLKRKSTGKIINILEFSRRAIQSYLAQGRAGRVSLELIAKELTTKLVRGLAAPIWSEPFDPTSYLYLKAGEGAVALKDETSVMELIMRIRPNGEVKVKRLGSAINEVFLGEAGGERFVIKKFSDWFVFKWFTLNIVAFGSKIFSVSGRERLSNEYGVTNLLEEEGLPVPKIIHVSLPKRILVKEYIRGRTYLDMVKQYINLNLTDMDYDSGPFHVLGETMARVHSIGVALGDTKPENFIYSMDKTAYILDLEQARRDEDFAWDIAEFLYYSGHYGLTLNDGIKSIVEEFLNGYMSGGGEYTTLKRAASLPYLKVFSFWTPLPILIYLSNRLKKVDSRKT
ncbi:MAG: nucleotidyltransferase domain-containing protein [Candidatus Bathyarchaeia archaeon]